MADIAALGLEVRSNGLKEGIRRLRDLESQGGKTERTVKGMGDAVGRTDRNMQTMNRTADRLKSAIGALAGVMSVREVIRYSDSWSNAANQLRQVTSNTAELTQVQQALVDVARDTRSNFDATANLYARLARSTTDLGLSQQDLLDLTTTINQSFAASGATAEEASNAITQLSQGLASGALRGDEFNSVSEQAPGIMRAIAASLDLTIGELREFAATGGITAEIVVGALQEASDTIANDFGKTVATFGQDMEVARTNLVEWVGTSEEVQGAIEALGDTFIYLSENIDAIVDIAQVAAALYAGRLVGSMATAAGALRSTATAAGVLRGAMMALGGPIGLLIGAGGLLYTFREELGFVQDRAGLTEDQIADLKEEMREMSNAEVGTTLSELSAELDNMTLRAANAREELAKLREENRGSGVLGFEGGSVGEEVRGMQAVAEAQERIEELNDRIAVARGEQAARIEQNANALVVYANRISEATDETDDNTDSTDNNTRATNDAAAATDTFATELENLRRRLDPAYARQQDLQRATAMLDMGLRTGALTLTQYLQLWDAAAETFIDAGRESDNLVETVTDGTDEMTREMERFGNAVDDVFVDAFKGAFDSFEEFSDRLKNAFESLMAELAYAALKNEIRIQLGMDASGMMQGGIGQLFGGSGGGLNLSSLGSIGNTVSGWFGGSSAASGLYAGANTGAVAGTLYGSANTGAAVGGLYGNAVTGGIASSGGIMGAASAAMPWIAGGMALDNILGLGIVDGIVGGISSLFGGGETTPRLNISTRGDASQFDHESVRTGAFGAVGFSEGTRRSNDLFGSIENERQWLDSVAALDNMLASVAQSPEQLDAMTSAVQNVVLTAGDATTANDMLVQRTAAAARIIDAEFTQSLVDAGATAEEITQRFVNANAAMQTLNAVAERLNLQWDAGAEGALRYADAIASQVGGVQQLAALQESYYQQYFSDAERTANLQADLTSTLGELGMTLPETREGFRALVEAQDLSTEAGQRNYAALLQTAGSFDQLTTALQAQEEAARAANQAIWDNIESSLENAYSNLLGRDAGADELHYWMSQIESGATTLDGALAEIGNSLEYHTNQWLAFESELAAAYEASLGRTANTDELQHWLQQIESGAVTLDGALSQIAGSIEAAEFDAAGGAAGLRERAQLNRQLLQAQGNTEALRALELEALHEANRPLQERIWALQDEQEALREAEQNQQRYNQALESAQSAFASFSVGIDDWLAQLRGTEQGLGSPADQLAATSEAFEEQYAKALAGDRDALGSITQYADRFIEAQKGWSASGMLTTSTIDRVSGMLESLPDLLSPEEFLAEEFRNALGDQSDTLSAAFDASTAAAVSALIPKFDAIDTNTDGLLTFSELSAALAGKATDAEIRALISRVDANGDGMISEQELANYRLGRVASDIGSELEPMFDAIDLNTDGLIDYAEFGRYFSGLATDAELKNIFRTLDADGDGQISRLEAIKGSSQNTDNQTDSLAKFFERAGNPSWGLRVSLSYHQDVSATQAIGYHVANEIRKMARDGAYVDRFADGGAFVGGVQAFADGGAFTNSIVSSPTAFNMGLMGEAGPEAIMPLTRHSDGSLGVRAELPPMPHPPLLGQSDVTQVMRDMQRTIEHQGKTIERLLNDSNQHLTAANVQRGAAATQQIAATKEGNKMLRKMQDDARLEAAKQ